MSMSALNSGIWQPKNCVHCLGKLGADKNGTKSITKFMRVIYVQATNSFPINNGRLFINYARRNCLA